MYWMMGGFGGVDWQQSWLMIALIPVLIWICCQSQPMNMLALGETSARQLGLPLWFWRNLLVVATGWMVGVSVALAGCYWFYRPGYSAYFASLRLNRSPGITSRLCADGGDCTTTGGCGRPTGTGVGGIAYRRGHCHAGRAGIYLVVAQICALAHR
ncbi:vtamin B12-transporter permease [Salmonella bongori]|nr:vtamin B12-transporter permease [Salmonella bongori]